MVGEVYLVRAPPSSSPEEVPCGGWRTEEAVPTGKSLGVGILLVSRSVHKEFLWSGVAVGHKGWARIPDNTYLTLVSGNLCQSTQRMGHHGAQVSKPLALEADEDTVTMGPRLVTPVPTELPGARPQAVRMHYLHLCSGTMVTPGTHFHPR